MTRALLVGLLVGLAALAALGLGQGLKAEGFPSPLPLLVAGLACRFGLSRLSPAGALLGLVMLPGMAWWGWGEAVAYAVILAVLGALAWGVAGPGLRESARPGGDPAALLSLAAAAALACFMLTLAYPGGGHLGWTAWLTLLLVSLAAEEDPDAPSVPGWLSAARLYGQTLGWSMMLASLRVWDSDTSMQAALWLALAGLALVSRPLVSAGLSLACLGLAMTGLRSGPEVFLGCGSVAVGLGLLGWHTPRPAHLTGTRRALAVVQDVLGGLSPLRWVVDLLIRACGLQVGPSRALTLLWARLDGPGPNFD